MFSNREKEAKREKDHERKAKYAFLATIKISPAQVITDWNLRLPPRTLLPMQPVRTLDKNMPEPTAPHKSMLNLWSVGTLRGRLSPGMP